MKWLMAIAKNIKVQAHAVWLCARDPALDWGLRLLALAIAGYALSPIDLIPDFIPVLGVLDDAILIPLGIWIFLKLAPPELYAHNLGIAKAADGRPVSRTGAAVIIGIWLAMLIALGFAARASGWL
jgi:uncharacterized membrane protein YkvA (DUF1232 family)